ncbi:hypothetical protein [Mycolicibacterium goodii]|uniref:hypothetical protein n=1 Tax=Mycolicibacterium goodii TaxID=134601 RepID=UPI001BDCAA40|nr:hypothetical protein [Mycolicibacterium goodii]MBU8831491.1 hypothetical protein [Mycolicibacterium goodii]
MADLPLSYFQLDGTYRGIVPDTFDPGLGPDYYNVWCDVTLTLRVEGGPKDRALELRLTGLTPPQTVLFVPVNARIETGVLRIPRQPAPPGETPTAGQYAEQEAATGVRMLAKSTALGLGTGKLLCDVKFGLAKIQGEQWRFSDFTFECPTVETYDPDNPVKLDLTTVPRYTPAAS